MNDMWLVELSPAQGEHLRCFVKGTDDPAEAIRLAKEKLGVKWSAYNEAR